jgi:hypothetical protein
MAFKMKGHALPGPYQKKTKTFTTDDEGNVRKTVTRTSKKGDVKSTKVVDYDPTGKRTKKTTTTKQGTRTVKGTGLDAVVTDRHGRTSTRRENIKRDVGDLVKGTVQIGAMAAGAGLGSLAANPAAAKTIAGVAGRIYGGGLLGGAIGGDVATRTVGVAGGGEAPNITRGVVEAVKSKVKGGVEKIKDLPSNIKKKVHEKRKSKAKK